MINKYLEPSDLAYISEEKEFSNFEIGSKISFMTEEIYDFSEYQIALLGVKEARLAGMKNLGCDLAPEEIRKQLYRLQANSDFPNSIDLGNIKDMETVEETYNYLDIVLEYLYAQHLVVLIIGGSQDLTISQFKSLIPIQNKINIGVVDERIDYNIDYDTLQSDSFLNTLLHDYQNNLNHISFLGYQSYFVNSEILKKFQLINSEFIRLGIIRENIPSYKYIFRNSDMISVDISSVRQSDAPGRNFQTPNGFAPEELCQIAFISGLSLKTKSFGLYEINPQFDMRNQTIQLAAQTLWYFFEGYQNRISESPENPDEKDNFKTFLVELTDFNNIVWTFWQSKITNDWWVEIYQETIQKSSFFPCSRLDFEQCSHGEMSDWIFSLMKKII